MTTVRGAPIPYLVVSLLAAVRVCERSYRQGAKAVREGSVTIIGSPYRQFALSCFCNKLTSHVPLKIAYILR